jgi:predicted TIM-barrel fold metal-dependent hydrolase
MQLRRRWETDTDVMPPVIDAHTHLLPGRLAEKVRGFFAPIAEHLVYPLDHDVVRQRLSSEGIDEIWTLPYAHKPGVAEGLNASTALIARQPGPLDVVGGATVHPADEDPVGIVRRAVVVHGLRVLKLHCSVGDFEADDARLDGVWRLAAELGLPVVVHAGHDPSGRTTAAEVAPLGRVADRHPEAVIIIAHCGSPAVDAALDLVERHAAVHADLTPVLREPVTVPGERLPQVASKLLFGSDAPNTGIAAGDLLAAVRSLPIPADVIEAITGGTARRLGARLVADGHTAR